MEDDTVQVGQQPQTDRREEKTERRLEVVRIAVTIVDIFTRWLDVLVR